MKSRQLTINEIFPIAHQQDLIKRQSEHFVSNALADGSIESGYKNMPLDFPQTPDNIPLIVNTKPPQFFITTYLKNNWKPLLVVAIVVTISVTAYHKLKQRKEKKTDDTKIPKTLYYNYPKTSM